MTRNVKSTLLREHTQKGVFTLETPKFEWVRKASVCGNYDLIEKGKEKGKGLLKFIVFEESERNPTGSTPFCSPQPDRMMYLLQRHPM